MSDEEAYQTVKKISEVCSAAKSKKDAEQALRSLGLWYEWVSDFPPYVKIHGR